MLPAPGDGVVDGDAAEADGAAVGGVIVDMGVHRSPGADGSRSGDEARERSLT